MEPYLWIIILSILGFFLLVTIYLAWIRYIHGKGVMGPYLVKVPGESQDYRIQYKDNKHLPRLKVKESNGWTIIEEERFSGLVSSFLLKNLKGNSNIPYTLEDSKTGKNIFKGEVNTLNHDSSFKRFSFMAMSDVQIQDIYAVFQHWFKVVIKNQKPDFIIECGDLVSKVILLRFRVFFNMFRGVLSKIPIFYTGGNHDYDPDDGRTLRQLGLIPTEESGYWYWFRNGPVYFIALSTNHMKNEKDFDEETRWLELTLKELNGKAKCIIIFFHYAVHGPDYSVSRPDAMKIQEEILRSRWVPLFEKHDKVKLVINGHKHVYSRTVKNDIVYQIVGSFQGVRKYPKARDGDEITLNKHAVIKVVVEEEKLTILAYDLLGRIFDRKTIPI